MPKPSIKGPEVLPGHPPPAARRDARAAQQGDLLSNNCASGANGMRSEIHIVITAVGDPVHLSGIINTGHITGAEKKAI